MTLLKLLATALVVLSFMVIALPGYAANDGDGVINGTPNNPQDPAAKPRRHHKHQRDGQRHHRRLRNRNPDQAPVNGGSGES